MDLLLLACLFAIPIYVKYLYIIESDLYYDEKYKMQLNILWSLLIIAGIVLGFNNIGIFGDIRNIVMTVLRSRYE